MSGGRGDSTALRGSSAQRFSDFDKRAKSKQFTERKKVEFYIQKLLVYLLISVFALTMLHFF